AAQLRVVQLGACPHADEYFLEDLFGLGAILHDPRDEAEQETAVTVVEVRKRGGVAGDDALQEIEIGRVAAVHREGTHAESGARCRKIQAVLNESVASPLPRSICDRDSSP